MKQRLIILSDLWGQQKSQWVEHYQKLLEDFFDITFYDCCELGKINKLPYEEKALHKQFVAEGIDTAVKNLLAAEPEKVTVLAFSIGGAIAWKAAMQSLRFESMHLVSATRLREEERKPLGRISLTMAKKTATSQTKAGYQK